jgi:hypothetical protein
MSALLLTALIILLTLSAIGYVAAQRAAREDQPDPKLTLLPGDISYESKSGTLLMRFFG